MSREVCHLSKRVRTNKCLLSRITFINLEENKVLHFNKTFLCLVYI